MAINFKTIFNGLKVKAKSLLVSDTMGEIEVDSSTGKLNYHNGSTRSPAVTETHTATLTNKNLSDSTTAIVDASDITKKIKFDASGATGTSTTLVSSQNADRTITLPDASDTLVGKATTDVLTNKSIDADTNTITNIENADIKVGAAIDAAKIADGSVSNTEFQRLDGILSSAVGISDTQVLTNKTIDADLNTITNIENADIKSGANIAFSKLAPLTASKATITDASGVIITSATTDTEIGYVSGVTSSIQTQINSKIASTEKGAINGVASLDGSGLIPITQLPPSAIERLVIVADQAARFALTIATVQNGDTVKQSDTGDMYYVKDDTNLGNSNGYAVYSAGTASSVPWSGVTGTTGVITNNEINASAAIADTKLATISTAGKVSNSATTATSTNTNSTIVARDASGNFSAGTITASLAGNASTVTTNANLTGPVTSVGNATSIGTGVITSTMILDGTILDADINASAAIARTKLANGTASTLVANSAGGALSDITDITLGTNNLTLANTKHLELQAATDSTTTGSNASLTAFTGGAIRLTNASLVSLANIPAGANGQEMVIFNRTGANVSIVDSSGAVGTAANRIFTGTSANITFAKDSALILQYDSTSTRWQVVGGSGSGSGTSELPLGTLAQQTFETAVLADFTQTGLALVSTNPIKGTKSAQLISAGSTQSFKQVIPVDLEFRGKNLTLDLQKRSSATQGNVTILITDETNSATLAASQPITLGSTTVSVTTNTNTTLSGISVADINKLKIGQTITGTGIQSNTIITAISTSALTATISPAATASATITAKISDLPSKQSFTFDVPTSCASLSYTISALAETGSPETYVDDIAIKLTSVALSTASVTTTTYNTTEWAPYTPTFTGFGTPSSVEFEWRQNGANYDIRGKFVSGTSTAVEARVSLPNAQTSASSSIIPSLQLIGYGILDVATATQQAILIEPSVSYLTFGAQTAGTGGLAKQNGSTVLSSGQKMSFFASVPISGLTGSTTTSQTIPLTTSQLVQTPDSYLQLNNFTGSTASTNTKILYLISPTIVSNVGSAIQYSSSSVLGDSFTALVEGIFTFNLTVDGTAASSYFGLSKNSTSLTSNFSALTASEKLATSTNADISTLSWTGKLQVGDVVRMHDTGTGGFTNATINELSISFQGSLKQLNPSTDTKITIPTHQLRFEGASALGSTDTAIVKFDTQTLTQGDGFSVLNTAANGTVVTATKAGILTVTSCLLPNVATNTIRITKNQQTLTSSTVVSGEVMGTFYTSSSNTGGASCSFPVNVGDKIRVNSGNPIAANGSSNYLSLSLQETAIAANFSNVLPQWSQSDSCLQFNTFNAYGSTNTAIARFTNQVQNVGTDISYTDSATLGASFTILTSGIYQMSFNHSFNSAGNNLGFSKNSVNLTTAISSLPAAEILAMGSNAATNSPGNASWQGYLAAGDIVRPHTDVIPVGTIPSRTEFTISKVGKPNLTAVDVTPFVQIPQQDVEAIESIATSSTFGSTNTGVPVLTITKNTNLGIIQVISDSVNGTSFKALKDSTLTISTSSVTTSASSVYVTKNATILTVTTPDGIVANTGLNGGALTANITLKANDVVRLQRNSTNTTNFSNITLTATAISPSIATPVQQVSSDTLSFVFQSTALTGNEAIGTFNTYTYAINTNTPTIATSAPTQTTSSMNINGVQVFTRPYNAASTAGNPARVDIVIGKGLKSKQVDAYGGLTKTLPIIYDRFLLNSTQEAGVIVIYNEITGILSITGGLNISSSIANHYVEAEIGYTSGYFVFNASKSPSLVTIPNLMQRVAYLSDVKANNTNGGSASATTTATRTLNTIVDSTGIVTSLASNQFTLPAGTYKVFARVPGLAVNNHKARLRNISDSTTAILGSSAFASSAGAVQSDSIIDGEVSITSSKIFEIQHYTTAARATDGQGSAVASGDSEVFTTVTITKIK